MNKHLFTIIFIIGCFFLNLSVLKSSDRVKFAAGYGAPELVNIGARFKFTQNELGFSLGVLPINGGDAISFSGDWYICLTSGVDFESKNPWFLKWGVNFTQYTSEKHSKQALSANIRFARDLYFSDKAGMQLYGGIAVGLSGTPVIFLGTDPIRSPIIPSYGFTLFFKI